MGSMLPIVFFGFLRIGEELTSVWKILELITQSIQMLSESQSNNPTIPKGVDFCEGTVEIFSDIRGMALGLLFGCRDGTYLTRKTFIRVVKQELETAGMVQSHYCSHSFRIGAATTKQHSVPAGIPKDQLTFYSRILGAQDHSADN